MLFSNDLNRFRWVLPVMLSLLFPVVGAASPDGEPNFIAVLEMRNDEGTGVALDEVSYFSSVLRGAIVDGAVGTDLQTMTRETIDVYLKGDVKCLVGKCLVDIGRTLQAQYVVGGEIKKIGDRIGVMVEAYKTANGTALANEQGTAASINDLEGVIREVGGRVIAKVTGRRDDGAPKTVATGVVTGGKVVAGVTFDRGEKIVNQMTDEKGFLVIKTVPDGANISINGKPVGRSPVQLDKMIGRYVIVAEMGALYHPARQDVALGTDGARVTLELKPSYGGLMIDSIPQGAEIWLNGEPTGQVTPYRADKKPAREYEIMVRKDKYLDDTQRVVLAEGQTLAHQVTLQPNWGKLQIISTPSGAAIEIDGVMTGYKSPITLDQVKTGVHSVRLVLSGHGVYAVQSDVGRMATATVNATLQPKLGMLKVMAETGDGRPCDGDVRVDDRVVGMAPWKGQIIEGRHGISVTCNGRTGNRTVEVTHNQETSVVVTAGQAGSATRGNTRAVRDLLTDRAKAPARTKISAAPWSIFGVGAAMLVTGGVLTGLASSERSAITDKDTYPDGTTNVLIDDAIDHQDTANAESKGAAAMYAIGGTAAFVGLIWGIVDAVQVNKAKRQAGLTDGETRHPVLAATPVEGGAIVGLSGGF